MLPEGCRSPSPKVGRKRAPSRNAPASGSDRRTATDGYRLVMTESVPEAQLTKTDAGLIPQGEGWFVLNARDVSWIRSEERGQDTDFEEGQEWTELGFRIQILGPGQHSLYHGENGQEDFLVVSGECVLVIEGEERRLKAWDFVHPAVDETRLRRRGDGPCVIVMAGSRAGGFEVVYALDEAAKRARACPRRRPSRTRPTRASGQESVRRTRGMAW